MKTRSTKPFYIIVATFLLFGGSSAKAQSAMAGKFNLGIGFDALATVGNEVVRENLALGLTPRLQYGVSNRFAITLTSGFYSFFSTDPDKEFIQDAMNISKSTIIPVKLGAKVFLGNNFYLAGEAGAVFEEARNPQDRVHFLWSPGIGYATKHWDIGARYEDFSGDRYTDGVIGLRVAYGFGL